MLLESDYKEQIHKDLCTKLHDVYVRKNGDYGSSFTKQYNKYGLTSVLIRLNDKLSRLEALTNGVKQQVNDESIDDTLLDLANYALLALVERKYEAGDFDCYNLSAPEPQEEEPKETFCEMSEEGFKNLLNAIFAEDNAEEKVNVDEIFAGDPDLDDDDDEDDDDDDHDIYDIYRTLEEVYGKANNELNKLKNSNKAEQTKKVEPKATFYECSLQYDPKTDSYEFLINDNGSKEKRRYNKDFIEINDKVEELEKKGIKPWDLRDLCNFF